MRGAGVNQTNVFPVNGRGNFLGGDIRQAQNAHIGLTKRIHASAQIFAGFLRQGNQGNVVPLAQALGNLQPRCADFTIDKNLCDHAERLN